MRARGIIAVAVGFLAVQGCSQPTVAPHQEQDPQAVAPLKRINPPVAVMQHRDMGRPIEVVLANLVEGRAPVAEKEHDGCAWSTYEIGEWAEVAYWDCHDDERIITFSRDGSEEDRIIADRDYDGRVDALMLDEDGLHFWLEDDNGDGRADRESADYDLVSDSVTMNGYPEGCLPPQHPGLRIRKDSDFDGYLDRESLTASTDPSGDMTAGWTCN